MLIFAYLLEDTSCTWVCLNAEVVNSWRHLPSSVPAHHFPSLPPVTRPKALGPQLAISKQVSVTLTTQIWASPDQSRLRPSGGITCKMGHHWVRESRMAPRAQPSQTGGRDSPVPKGRGPSPEQTELPVRTVSPGALTARLCSGGT